MQYDDEHVEVTVYFFFAMHGVSLRHVHESKYLSV
jgi:hypothetical protein